MAYVIGSQKGKDIAESMKTGETYKASDGSTWTKQSDGSVSVTHNGLTTNNAYKSTSGGGSTVVNSQYTKPTLGNTWDANTDYQAIINYAVHNQDFVTAAKAEQLRNQKIAGTGSSYAPTYIYQGFLAGDTQQSNQQNYLDAITQYMQNYLLNNPQPTAPYRDARIDQKLNEILNRDDFSYDVTDDPLYDQYAQMYQREGDRAMRNTLAEAASGAGGMNSYAITAAMQANNYYNSQLNDKIPELYQLAYDMYLKEKESQIQDLGILQDMDATQYNRYRDTMNDWQNDKTFAYGMYNDAVNQGQWKTNLDYNTLWNGINLNNNNYWADKEYNANQSQIDIENSRYDQEKAEKQLLAIIESGVMPDDDVITKAGWNKATVEQLVAQAKADKAAQAAKGSKSNGSGGNGGNGGDGGDGGGGTQAKADATWTSGLADLGLGFVYSPDLLVDLEEAGGIYEDNGKLKWADGWNAQNFESKLAVYKTQKTKNPFESILTIPLS